MVAAAARVRRRGRDDGDRRSRAVAGAVRHRARRVGDRRRGRPRSCSRARLGRCRWRTALQRLARVCRARPGAASLAHAGAGMMTIGIVAMTAYQSEQVLVMKPGEIAQIGGYSARPSRASRRGAGRTIARTSACSTSRAAAGASLELNPAKRLYDAPRQTTTEAGIHASWRGDLYTVLGDAQTDGGYVRAALLQSARALHLDRRAGDVLRRVPVADGSAPAGSARRSGRAGGRRARAGGVRR